jgi:hypothetical protein
VLPSVEAKDKNAVTQLILVKEFWEKEVEKDLMKDPYEHKNCLYLV